jgi:hypothetical protein
MAMLNNQRVLLLLLLLLCHINIPSIPIMITSIAPPRLRREGLLRRLDTLRLGDLGDLALRLGDLAQVLP